MLQLSYATVRFSDSAPLQILRGFVLNPLASLLTVQQSFLLMMYPNTGSEILATIQNFHRLIWTNQTVKNMIKLVSLLLSLLLLTPLLSKTTPMTHLAARIIAPKSKTVQRILQRVMTISPKMSHLTILSLLPLPAPTSRAWKGNPPQLTLTT